MTVAEARIDARHANDHGISTSERARLCAAAAPRFRAAPRYLVAQSEHNSFGEGIFGPNNVSLDDLRVCEQCSAKWRHLQMQKSNFFVYGFASNVSVEETPKKSHAAQSNGLSTLKMVLPEMRVCRTLVAGG